MDYIFKKSDPNKPTFTVKPYTTNGPASPNTPAPLHPQAVSADSSLVLVGQGKPAYGDVVQNNLLYLLESFASPKRPAYPTQGQIWYKNTNFNDVNNTGDPFSAGLYVFNGIDWDVVFLTGSVNANLNMNRFSITNVAAPTGPTDVAIKSYVDLNYLSLVGGTINGDVVVGHVDLVASPTLPSHAARKDYVDSNIAAAVSPLPATYLSKSAPDTFSGTLTSVGDANLVMTGLSSITFSGTGDINMGGSPIRNVSDPVISTDVATKAYVDALGGVLGADGVVTGGTFDDVTGVLALNRSNNLPNVTIGGAAIAAKQHAHDTTTITFNADVWYANSLLHYMFSSKPLYPNIPMSDVIHVLDQVLYTKLLPASRTVVDQTVLNTTLFYTAASYRPEYNELACYLNGVKQIANQRGAWSVVIAQPLTLDSDTGFALSSVHSFTISVTGGAGQLISVSPVTATYPMSKLVLDVNTALAAANVQATLSVVYNSNETLLTLYAVAADGVSSIAVTGDTLFSVLPSAGVPIIQAPIARSYREDGPAMVDSGTITFVTAPPVSSVIEIIIK